LLIIDSLEIGGAERHVADLAIALRCKGYGVTVACSAGGPLFAELETAGIGVRVLMTAQVKRRVSPGYTAQLRRLLQERQVDLVHAHVYASSVAAALATLGADMPLILTVHSESLWQGPLARWISRHTYRGAAGVIAVSETIGRRLIEIDGLEPDRVRVIGNAVAPTTVRAYEPLGLPPGWEDAPLVGVVARLQSEKGVGTFLDAVVLIRSRCPHARYCVVGDGPLRGALAGRVRELGLEDRVHFLGCRVDARALLPALDVLAVPSISEGEPLVVLEAMEAGVPIVATRVGGIPRQVRHERDGLLVPPGDPVALSNSILRLLQHPADAEQLARTAQERVRATFSYEAMLNKIERCYDGILTSREASELVPVGLPSLHG
jgi:glycosyltransferase involved in cell wall biosynthesis